MNDTISESHDTPHPHFIETLEMQMRMTNRRQALLEALDDETTNRPRMGSRKGLNMLGIITLIVTSMMLGATGTYAVVHQDESPQRDLLIRKAEIYLKQAELRYAQAEADYAELKPLADQGFISETETEMQQQQIFNARSELERRRFDLEEITVSGKPVNNDLNAPLVDGEDFVLARLRSALQAIEFELKRARTRLDHTRKLFESGFITDRELAGEKLGVQQATQGIERLKRRIQLRQDFIAGDISAEEVELQGMLQQAESDLQIAELKAVAVRRRFEETKTLYEQGMVNSSEVREARAAFHEAESELELAIVQLEMIREGLEGLESKQM